MAVLHVSGGCLLQAGGRPEVGPRPGAADERPAAHLRAWAAFFSLRVGVGLGGLGGFGGEGCGVSGGEGWGVSGVEGWGVSGGRVGGGGEVGG